MMNTATILQQIKDRIEALVPTEQAGPDDVFRLVIGLDTTSSGSRVGVLTALGGRPVAGRTKGCNSWETQIELSLWYVSVPTEAGQTTVMQTALADSEDILADLLLWSSQTVGIHQLVGEMANISDTGNGEIQITRFLSIEFERS